MQTIRLPKLITKKNKLIVTLIAAALSTLFYLLTNHFHLTQTHTLPLSNFEKNLEVTPWMIWIYLTMYGFVIGAFLKLEDEEILNRIGWAYILVQLVSYTFFILFPVVYPRDPQAIMLAIQNSDPITRFAFTMLWETDSPANCFPSLHVSNVFLISFAYLQKKSLRQKTFWFAISFSSIIAYSTIATKQHYLWDVISGIILAACAYTLLFNRKLIKFS